MASKNKVKSSFKSEQFIKTSNDKRKVEGNGRAGGVPFKKPTFIKSKEFQKKATAAKIQERKALKAQKQKQLEEERAKAKQEKEEKIRQYKKKRLEKTKAISKRTQRGQPLMKDRMQLLLKQIQEMKKNR